jgi:hypothetical protein
MAGLFCTLDALIDSGGWDDPSSAASHYVLPMFFWTSQGVNDVPSIG